MSLKEYIRKRVFTQTPEPTAKKGSGDVFVIQKHDATHLHYDFRLGIDGVLKSWVIPKGPSLNPADKRLALQVEDHPYDYRDFEGMIPEGNYGAGTVMIWDEGTYTPLSDKQEPISDKKFKEDLEKGKIHFALNGKKLKGAYALFKFKGGGPKENSWMIVKSKDKAVTSQDILKQDRSAKTGRSLNEIAHKQTRAPISPMLSTLADGPFDSPDWLFEIKWDGFRAIAEVDKDEVSLYSRSFQSFNLRFQPIVEALQKLKIDAVFDGEIVILDKNGKQTFQGLQNYQNTQAGDLRYFIFDLLFYKGKNIRSKPILERKKLLKTLLPKAKSHILQFSDHVIGKGKKLYSQAEKQKLEGLMAKEIHSPYVSTRSRDWLKIKLKQRQEAVICGFTEPKGSRKAFGSLLLGIWDEDHFRYIGHAGTGFTESTLQAILERLNPLITKKCPFPKIPADAKKATWVKPEILCEVSFTEWTKENQMRHPVFEGLREDKKPHEVKKEEPLLTNLDKVYWPKEGITKGDLLDYYRKIAPFILPYLVDRPESLHRHPNGIKGEAFFQKNVDHKLPDWVATYPVQHSDKLINYLVIPDEETLLFAINLGCIELNPFSSRIPNLDFPDYLILDLDPEKISFDKVVETALTIHELLSKHDIPHYCKTSGATGLHIYLPMGGQYPTEIVKRFAELLVNITHEMIPSFTSIERKPQNREKKVYLDFLQNNFGQTLAAPYCVRPRSGAPVSTPLEWKEVKLGLDPLDFTIKNVPDRLKKKGDPFLPVLGKGLDIEKCIKRLKR